MNNKIPPPILALICGLSIYFSRPLFSEKIYIYSNIISISFFFFGTAFLVLAVLSFKKQKTTISPLHPEKASVLVISNVFKYSRNPMYLGMLFILISLSIRYNIIGGIIAISIFIFLITKFQIKPEEVQMEKLFGEKYAQYKKRTRMWI